MNFNVAFATDDGETFVTRHFGDADLYHVYQISELDVKLIKVIENSTEEEEQHADPRKAKGISHLLKKEDVSVVVSKVFGPNIKRIKKHFVCIATKEESIESAITRIIENATQVEELWKKGVNREHLVI